MYIENLSLVTCSWNTIDLMPALAPGVGITFTQEAKFTFTPLGAVSKHVAVYDPNQSGLVTLNTLSAVKPQHDALIAAFLAEAIAPLVIYNSVSGDRWTFNNAMIPQLPDHAFQTGDAVQVSWTMRYESLIYLPGT
jgi:hypothetical protein